MLGDIAQPQRRPYVPYHSFPPISKEAQIARTSGKLVQILSEANLTIDEAKRAIKLSWDLLKANSKCQPN